MSVPTTYSGAEWTHFFGVRDEARRMAGGGGGANVAGIVYEPELTLDLPRPETGGTALNALAHCAEALYAAGHNPEADAEALAGAPLVSEWLPQRARAAGDLEARTRLLEGAMHAGAALGGAGLALAHAIAQALGGAYGLPHGAMNALVLRRRFASTRRRRARSCAGSPTRWASTTPPTGQRSSRGSAASSGSATSASRTRTSASSPRPPPSAAAPAPTRAGRAPARSRRLIESIW